MNKSTRIFLLAMALVLIGSAFAYAAPQTDSTPPDASLDVQVDANVAQVFELTVSDDFLVASLDPETSPTWSHTVDINTKANTAAQFTKTILSNDMNGGSAPTFTADLVASGAAARGDIDWADNYDIAIDWTTDPGDYQAVVQYTLVD